MLQMLHTQSDVFYPHLLYVMYFANYSAHDSFATCTYMTNFSR